MGGGGGGRGKYQQTVNGYRPTSADFMIVFLL